jgi:hypothetical protein
MHNFLLHYRPLAKVWTLFNNSGKTPKVNKPSKAVLRLPIEKRAEIAFKVAVAKAIDEHTRLSLPVYIWRNHRVVKLSPHKTPSSSRRRK